MLVLFIILLLLGFFISKLLIEGKIAMPCKIQNLEIECSSSDSLFQYLEKNHNLRSDPNVKFKDIVEQDCKNLEIVIALINQCSLMDKKLTFEQGRNIWIALHHSPYPKHLLEYYPFIEKMYVKKLINSEMFALSTDRVLVGKNLPQLYGTQLKANGKLFEYDNIDSVIIRRKNLGLLPLDDYILRVNKLN